MRPTAQAYYRDVSVLVLHWKNDDKGVDGLKSEPMNLFAGSYNLSTEHFREQFREYSDAMMTVHGGEHTLRIVVYSGHAQYADTTGLEWSEKRANAAGNLVGPMIGWRCTRGTIDTEEGDALYIFGCCSSDHGDGPEMSAAFGMGANGNSEHPLFAHASPHRQPQQLDRSDGSNKRITVCCREEAPQSAQTA
ncbi:hypothetical protein BDV33DRAFT_203924 [Aspergillus novoparasiticus]|uniref:Uncharacterized protein n=1 Tax=Aspergillus novoparasiticus TaxID=986946 RepID=A0A5N6ERW6_9EURO|nr:hypothetical protein BDV33DRAFT_203924 [Aspergillus novoparasiticus]